MNFPNISRRVDLVKKNRGFTPFRDKSLTGFTLAEMLVVMFIILSLCLLIYPTIIKAIKKGEQGQCISNLKQIGLAIQMYTNDYNDHLPYAKRYTYADDPESIVKFLSSYINNPKVFICESTEKSFKEGFKLSYVYNIKGDLIDSLHQIGRPARSATIGNTTETWVLVDARSPDHSNPHLDFANSLWLDGHVEATKAD